MLFYGERRIDHGERLPTSRHQAPSAMVEFDDKWANVLLLSDKDLISMSMKDVASYSPISEEEFANGISGSLVQWRENPGRSFISSLSNAPGARGGVKMFDSLEKQTAFLTGLINVGLGDRKYLEAVRSSEPGKRHHRERGSVAITTSDAGRAYVNDMARAFHVWEKRNAALVRAGRVKLPKKLYRGIRRGDAGFPDFSIPREHHKLSEVRGAALTELCYQHLISTPVRPTFPGNVLSFTANETVAKYFADQKGFILSVDPRDVDIVAGWNFIPELDVHDDISGKHEREWIVRLSPDYRFTPETVEIFEEDWLMVNGDVRGIPLVGHGTKARYQIGDVKLEAVFEYKPSGVGGSVRFFVNGGYLEMSRTAIKKEYGVDPVPSDQSEVSNLQFLSYDRYSWEKKPVVINQNDAQFGMSVPRT